MSRAARVPVDPLARGVEVVAGGQRLVRDGKAAVDGPGLDDNAREPAAGAPRRCC